MVWRRRTPEDVHLLNTMWDASGGSEWRTVMLYEMLRQHATVHVWSEHDVDAAFESVLPVRRVCLETGDFPMEGTLVFVGSYLEVGAWIRRGRYRRAVVIHNVAWLGGLEALLATLGEAPVERVDLVHTSRMIRGRSGRPGRIEYSWIDHARFRPGVAIAAAPFTVGRLSRDLPEKHHAEDPMLYRDLAETGMQVRVMGGRCLAPLLHGHDAVELLPVNAEPAPDFLRTLDAFVYRIGDVEGEPLGRVVVEAMATGIPVVVHAAGGYRELIRHGHDGFLFEETPEAFEILLRLTRDPELRAAVGRRARERVQRLYSDRERRRRVRWYLR